MIRRQKLCSIFFAIFFAVFMSFVFVACADESETCSHTGGDATCTQRAVCEVCSKPYGELAPHEFTVMQSDDSHHWGKCRFCEAVGEKTEHTGGDATCTQRAVCEVCSKPYGELAPHVYADEYTCHDRECIRAGCAHIEFATTEHTIEKYACIYCKTSIECSLEILRQDYEETMIESVKKFGAGEAEYSVVILNREETLKNLENYTFSGLDTMLISRGLFVKMELSESLILFYNFGLELSAEQERDVSVSTGEPQDPWYDEWLLEVVDGNKKLLFEFSL